MEGLWTPHIFSFSHWEKVAAKRTDEGRVSKSAQAVAPAGPQRMLGRRTTLTLWLLRAALRVAQGRRLRRRALALSQREREGRQKPSVFARSRIASSMRQGSVRAWALVKRTTVQPRASMVCWRR